jgi:hypothetical protein
MYLAKNLGLPAGLLEPWVRKVWNVACIHIYGAAQYVFFQKRGEGWGGACGRDTGLKDHSVSPPPTWRGGELSLIESCHTSWQQGTRRGHPTLHHCV